MNPPKYFYFRVKTDSKATKIILEDASDCDVVEVVRCGECIRKDICRTSNVWAVSPDDNWFCADGERKDGGQETPKEEDNG